MEKRKSGMWLLFVFIVFMLSCNLFKVSTPEEKVNKCYEELNLQDFDAALNACEKALDAVRLSGDRIGEVKVLNKIGQVYLILPDTDKALEHFNQAVSLSQETGDYSGEAIALNNISYLYSSYYYQYDLALEYLLKALDMCQKASDQYCTETIMINIGKLHQDIGDPEQALISYEKALVIQREIGDKYNEQLTLTSVGDIYYRQGDYKKALDYFQKSMSIQIILEDKLGEASSLNNIGEVYIDISELDLALEAFDKAINIQKNNADLYGMARTLNNIGEVYNYKENYKESLVYYNEAVKLHREVGNKNGEAATLNNIGIVYLKISNYDLAVKNLNEALGIWRITGYKYGEARTLLNLGKAYAHRKDYDEAIAVYEQAMKIHTEINDLNGKASALNNLAQLSIKIADFKNALLYSNQALEIQKQIGDRDGEMQSLLNIGAVYFYTETENSIGYFTQALTISENIGDLTGKAAALGHLADSYNAMGDYEKALELILKSITVSESLSSNANADLLQTDFSGTYASSYRLAVDLLVKQGDYNLAFEYSERGRSRALLNLLGNQKITPKINENSNLIIEEKNIRKELVHLQAQLTNELDRPTPQQNVQLIKDIEASIGIKRLEYEELLVQLQIANPEYGSLINIQPFALKDINKMLVEQLPKTTLLSYYFNRNELFIFVISENSFHVEVVPIKYEELRNLTGDFLAQMKAQPLLPNAWLKPSGALYQILIEPVKEFLPSPGEDRTYLGIIPYDILNYIPFGLLYNGEDVLLDKYSLFYAPSTSSLKIILNKRNPAEGNAFVIANSDVPGTSYLHYAEEEAKTVAKIYQVKPILGSDANEEFFKQQVGNYNIIHIVAHSDLNSKNPLFSALILQPKGAEDGRLETHEIFQLDLQHANLVVLSACQTHLGEITAGDEIVGLEQSFIRAGSPSLITTLWAVDDKATAEFMKIFYENLRGGIPKADALRIAQLEMKDQYANPYYWAGFILVGDAGITYH